MRKIISNLIALIIAIVGLIGGLIWGFTSDWNMEPIILISISIVQIIGFIFTKLQSESGQIETDNYTQRIINKKKVGKQINIQRNEGNITM